MPLKLPTPANDLILIALGETLHARRRGPARGLRAPFAQRTVEDHFELTDIDSPRVTEHRPLVHGEWSLRGGCSGLCSRRGFGMRKNTPVC